ncbi:MAG: hypothetical protein ACYTKD_19880 [Planctomycetota bacterium]|jgi:hypothetical protein
MKQESRKVKLKIVNEFGHQEKEMTSQEAVIEVQKEIEERGRWLYVDGEEACRRLNEVFDFDLFCLELEYSEKIAERQSEREESRRRAGVRHLARRWHATFAPAHAS